MRWVRLFVMLITLGCAGTWSVMPPSVSAAPVGQTVAPPTEVVVSQFSFDPSQNRYRVKLKLTDTSEATGIENHLIDVQTGDNTLLGNVIPVNKGGQDVDFFFSADALKTGNKYKLSVRALNGTTYIRREGTPSGTDDVFTLVSYEFAYATPQPPTVAMSIDGVNAQLTKTSRTLNISVNVSDTPTPPMYEAVVTDDFGSTVVLTRREPLQPGEAATPSPLGGTSSRRNISVALPDTVPPAGKQGDYHLTLRLYDSGNKLLAEQLKDFTLFPPPAPGLDERLMTVLAENPAIGGIPITNIIGAILLGMVIVYLIDRRPRWKRKLRRPQNLAPVTIGPAARVAPRVAPVAANHASVSPAPGASRPVSVGKVPGGTAAGQRSADLPPGLGASIQSPVAPARLALELQIGSAGFPVAAGVQIRPEQLGAAGKGRGKQPIAEIVGSSHDASAFGLKNLSGSAWTATDLAGIHYQIEPGRSIRLDTGVVIDLGGVQARVRPAI
jgi:hypothetical protein